MTKWPVQKPTHRTTQKHVEHHDATDIRKKLSVRSIANQVIPTHINRERSNH